MFPVLQYHVKLFAISDLHLSFGTNKPMDLFGDHWTNYEQRIRDDWNARVGADDVVIVAGDISWAMRMEDTAADFAYIKALAGTKIIVRGNHDYWWKSISKIREVFAPDTYALQNDAVKIGNIVFAGTRGWHVPERRETPDAEDTKIYNREVIRFELALKDAKTKMSDGDKLVAILHYPPFNAMQDPSPFTELCEKYGVAVCVYGHLHGKTGRMVTLVEKNGVKYYLTSCDILKHTLAEIEI